MSHVVDPNIKEPIQKVILFFLQNAKIGKIAAVCALCPLFKEYLLYCNDQQLWVMTIQNLLSLYSDQSFNAQKHSGLLSALGSLDSTMSSPFCRVSQPVKTVSTECLPFLFLCMPRYVLRCYYDPFQQNLLQTDSFKRSFYFACYPEASRYSNWFLAGIHEFSDHCHSPTDFEPLSRLLETLPAQCSAFQAPTFDDLTTLTAVVRNCPSLATTFLSLLKDPFAQELKVRLATLPAESNPDALPSFLANSDDVEELSCRSRAVFVQDAHRSHVRARRHGKNARRIDSRRISRLCSTKLPATFAMTSLST